MDHGISCCLTHELSPFSPSCANTQQKMVIVNTAWHNQQEIPFIFAHEIGHILNNDKGISYYQSATIHTKTEYQANLKAIELLAEYCRFHDVAINNPVRFCEDFGIPSRLDYLVASVFAELIN